MAKKMEKNAMEMFEKAALENITVAGKMEEYDKLMEHCKETNPNFSHTCVAYDENGYTFMVDNSMPVSFFYKSEDNMKELEMLGIPIIGEKSIGNATFIVMG